MDVQPGKKCICDLTVQGSSDAPSIPSQRPFSHNIPLMTEAAPCCNFKGVPTSVHPAPAQRQAATPLLPLLSRRLAGANHGLAPLWIVDPAVTISICLPKECSDILLREVRLT